jgi:hypothetical protein
MLFQERRVTAGMSTLCGGETLPDFCTLILLVLLLLHTARGRVVVRLAGARKEFKNWELAAAAELTDLTDSLCCRADGRLRWGSKAGRKKLSLGYQDSSSYSSYVAAAAASTTEPLKLLQEPN